jgi:hypothetical protein
MKRFDQTLIDAENLYAAWREANPEGFVLNEGAGDWMLHFASCSHLDQFSAFKADLLKNPKSCSGTLSELEEHASRNGKQLRKCSSCAPG